MRVIIKDGKVFEGVNITDIVVNMKRSDFTRKDKNYKYRKILKTRIPDLVISSDEAMILDLQRKELLEVDWDDTDL